MTKALAELLKSEHGKILKQFLVAHYLKLNLLDNLQEYSTTAAQALEVKATKRASRILKDILLEIIDAESFREAVKIEKNKLYL